MSASAAAGGGFTLKRVQELLGLSKTVVTGLVAAGFVSPQRGARNEQRFTFQDLLLLRTAHALQRAQIPPRKILRALTRLSATLPAELPLTGLRITAVGTEVAVHDRDGAWNPDTGQVLMDFEVARAGAELAFLPRDAAPAANVFTGDAQAWFHRAEDLEASDLAAAERAYRQAIALDASHAHAHLNLGAMLCESGRCEEARTLYEQALAGGASSPLLHFNHAIALEDLGLYHQALASYLKALELDPGLLDAHYNAGCLLEKMGDPRGALRHFSAASRLGKG